MAFLCTSTLPKNALIEIEILAQENASRSYTLKKELNIQITETSDDLDQHFCSFLAKTSLKDNVSESLKQ